MSCGECSRRGPGVGPVQGTQPVDQDAGLDGALGRALTAALDQPLAGPPRRPKTIRVADATLAAEVRSAIGDMIPIAIAPTPELDQLAELMVQSAPPPDTEESYLDDGRVPPAVVAELFQAASGLYRLAPWKVVGDHQVVRLDIPDLGVEGACLSIMGNLGESFGFVIFPSIAAYEEFCRVAELPRPPGGRIDLGTGWLALNYCSGADLPESMRSEAETHGWPVAGRKAWPVVERREADGALCPLTQRDIEIASATAAAFPALFVKHRGAIVQQFLHRGGVFSLEHLTLPCCRSRRRPGRCRSSASPRCRR